MPGLTRRGQCSCLQLNEISSSIGSGKGVWSFSAVSAGTMKDSRQYARLSSPKGTILACQNAGVKKVSGVINAGLGGLYIRTAEPPPAGTYIQLLFDVPAGEVRARAVVQRSQAKKGMGVKFVAMQQDDRARFAGWLKHLLIQGNPCERN